MCIQALKRAHTHASTALRFYLRNHPHFSLGSIQKIAHTPTLLTHQRTVAAMMVAAAVVAAAEIWKSTCIHSHIGTRAYIRTLAPVHM